ncbi:uncharacterized protein [Macaca nemestrina]|uniref:uncharacterized protein isoform X1 n=1 Tax=Macaca nemestrina TaxID=9545 RepID=UPI0039B8A46E
MHRPPSTHTRVGGCAAQSLQSLSMRKEPDGSSSAGSRRGGGSPKGAHALDWLHQPKWLRLDRSSASRRWSRLQGEQPPRPPRSSPEGPRCPLPFSSPAPTTVEAAGRGGAATAPPSGPPCGRGHDSGSDRLTFGALPSGDEGKMSLSGFKAKLKLLASIFHKTRTRRLSSPSTATSRAVLAAAVFWKGALYPGCCRRSF